MLFVADETGKCMYFNNPMWPGKETFNVKFGRHTYYSVIEEPDCHKL